MRFSLANALRRANDLAAARSPRAKNVKRWKLAISLAIAAAIVGPLATGSWKLKPGAWYPLPAEERDRIAKMAEYTANCTHFSPQDTDLGKTICTILLSDLHSGGRWENGERITWHYVEKNVWVVAIAFFLMFFAAMILPGLGTRYWAWLQR